MKKENIAFLLAFHRGEGPIAGFEQEHREMIAFLEGLLSAAEAQQSIPPCLRPDLARE